MKTIIIRDDDFNALSEPEVFERVHRPLLRAGKPLSVSVVPKVAGIWNWAGRNGALPAAAACKAPPMIPKAYQGKDKTYCLESDQPAAAFLRQHSNQLECLQHGLTHAPVHGEFEFERSGAIALKEAVAEGHTILNESLGQEPAGFVPPWDQISAAALSAVKAHYDILSIWNLWRPRKALVNLKGRLLKGDLAAILESCRHTGAYGKQRLSGLKPFRYDNMMIVPHPGYLLSRDRHEPKDIAGPILQVIERAEVTVLVNHYWEYQDASGRWLTQRLDQWHALLDQLLAREDIQITTFRKLRERF